MVLAVNCPVGLRTCNGAMVEILQICNASRLLLLLEKLCKKTDMDRVPDCCQVLLTEGRKRPSTFGKIMPSCLILRKKVLLWRPRSFAAALRL